MSQSLQSHSFNFLAGGGHMGEIMRNMDWSVSPLGDPESWPDILKAAVGTCLNSRFPMVIWWGPDLIMLYNDAWQPILGETKHPRGLGRPGAESWPETWPIVGQQFKNALQGEASWSEDLLLASDRRGFIEECYFTYSHSPLKDAAGTIHGVLSAVSETTAQVLGERRLRILHELSNKTILSAAKAQSTDQICSTLIKCLCDDNPDVPFAAVYAFEEDGIARLLKSEGIDPSLLPLEMDAECHRYWAFDKALKGEQPAVTTHTAFNLPGGVWPEPTHSTVALAISQSHQSENPFGILLVGASSRLRLDVNYVSFLQLVAAQFANSITVLDGIQIQLREKKRLEDVLHSIEDGYQAVDRHGRLTYMNRAALRMLEEQGVDGSTFIGKHIFDETLSKPIRDASYEGFMKCSSQRVPVAEELFFEPFNRWYAMRWFPMIDGGVTIYFRDITNRKNSEAAQTLLEREVDHRSKNALAIAMSIVSMSSGENISAFKQDVTGRIAALSRVHNLLSDSKWQGAELEDLIKDGLDALGANALYEIAGPQIYLTQAAVQPLTLILHELATNARKYGALQRPEGRLFLEWRITFNASLELVWLERNGPPLDPPTRRGFGTNMMDSLCQQLGTKLEREWLATGLRAKLILPKQLMVPIDRSDQTKSPTLISSNRELAQIASGRNILIVEDEAIVAMELSTRLKNAGANVIGPASNLEAGMKLAQNGTIDVALVDLNLNGNTAVSIADVLASRGVPFLFCTGYSTPIDGPHRGRQLLRKPVGDVSLALALQECLGDAS